MLPAIVLVCGQLLTPSLSCANAATQGDEEDDVELAQAVEFSPFLLRAQVDVSRFAYGNPVDPGEHVVELYINDLWQGQRKVLFVLPEGQKRRTPVARPCFTHSQLHSWSLELPQQDPAAQGDAHRDDRISKSGDGSHGNGVATQEEACLTIGQVLPGAVASYDALRRQLKLGVPQLYVRTLARGEVPAELWDEGIPAGVLDWNFNAWHSSPSGGHSSTTQHLALNGGLNYGAWRLRHRGSFSHISVGGAHYTRSNLWIERGINAWRSRLLLGEGNTDGQVFDSLGFRGAQLGTAMRMYADSQSGFAPEVRGIANTNARVEIWQRENKIFETTVPPGPFAIRDINPIGSGGDLRVRIIEANGSEHELIVPFNEVQELLRPGMTHYNVMLGQWRNTTVDYHPALFMGTIRHGFSNSLTGYGGATLAEGHHATTAGLALNTRLGAVSGDVTHSSTRLGEGLHLDGQRLRLSWSRYFIPSGTRAILQTFSTSGDGYLSSSNALGLRAALAGPGIAGAVQDYSEYRHRLQFSLSQDLPENYGSFFFSGSMQNHWNRSGHSRNYSLQYGNRIGDIGVSVGIQRSRDLFVSNKEDTRYSVSIDIPLGRNSGRNWDLNSSYNHSDDSRSLRNMVSGTFGERRQYNAGVYTDTRRSEGRGSQTTVGVNGMWRAPLVTLSSTWSRNSDWQQASASAYGSLVAWRGGLIQTPSSPLGEAIGIIEAPQAEGAHVLELPYLRLDARGFAVAPSLRAYRMNSVSVDPQGMSMDVSLLDSNRQIAPTKDAVVLLEYRTQAGFSVLLDARQSNGGALPFGANIQDTQGQHVGYVGQGGLALIRVNGLQGDLHVQWVGGGAVQDGDCRIQYDLSDVEHPPSGQLRRLEAPCK